MFELNAPARPRSEVDDQQVDLVLAGARQQRRRAGAAGAGRQAGHHPLQPLGIGTAVLRRVLRPAQLGGGDHLHRLGDLLRRLHRADADLEGLE